MPPARAVPGKKLCPLAAPPLRACTFRYDWPAQLAKHVAARHPNHGWTDDQMQRLGIAQCGTCGQVVSRRGHRSCPAVGQGANLRGHAEAAAPAAPATTAATVAATELASTGEATTGSACVAGQAQAQLEAAPAAGNQPQPEECPAAEAWALAFGHEPPAGQTAPAAAAAEAPAPAPAEPPATPEPVGSRTQVSLPAEAAELMASGAALAMERAVSAAAAGAEASFRRACVSLLAIAGRVACVAGQVTKRQRAKRMNAAAAAALEELLLSEDSQLAPGQVPGQLGQSSPAQRVARLAAQGELRRAASAVDGRPVLDGDPQVLAKLKALHPQGAPVSAGLARGVTPLAITSDQLDELVARAPSNRAPGPSGWRFEHLRRCYGSPRFRAALLAFTNQLLSGSCPRCPELQASRLVCLDKGGGGVRPIAMPEVWLKLADSASLLALRPAGTALAPLQLGGGLRGGIEAARWAVHTAAATLCDGGAPRIVIACDFRNAFNCVDRAGMLREVKARAPAALPYTRWKYGAPSPLLWSTQSMGTVRLDSSTGVRQGDPAGPTLFGLALQPALEAAARVQEDATVVAYHDDTYLVGEAESCMAAYSTLVTEAGLAGLEANKSKTQVCGLGVHGREAAQRVADSLGITHAPHGMRVLGGWLGADEQAFADGVVSDAGQWLAALDALDLPLQTKLLLARRCGWAKPLHLARACGMEAATHALGTADGQLAKLVAEWARAPGELAAGSLARRQMALPVRLGGLGLLRMTRQHCAAARLASARLAQQLLEGAKPWAQPLGPQARPELVQCLDVLQDSGALEKTPATLSELRGEEQAWGALPLQRAFTEAAAQAERADLARALLAAKDGTGAHRLCSAGDAASGAWLSALPRPGTLIPCQAVRDELCLRLGLTAIPCPVTACKCGGPADRLGHHALSCKVSAGVVCLRHTLVMKAWRDAATELGLETGRETPLANLVSADRTLGCAPWVA